MTASPSRPDLLQLVARLSGALALAFLTFMVVAHLVAGTDDPDGLAFRSATDGLQFALFPICTMLGLLLAYRWELLGAVVVIASMGALCIIRPDLLRFAMLIWASPALLYLAHWADARKQRIG
jgi:hypothetical protein